jgi:hypothetical protein
MNSIDLRTQVLLSLQCALLGEITPNIRGITCSWDTSKITIVCYLQDDISEDIEESMECVATEVMADFPEHQVEIECKKLDEPEPLNPYTLSAWVYRRKE